MMGIDAREQTTHALTQVQSMGEFAVSPGAIWKQPARFGAIFRIFICLFAAILISLPTEANEEEGFISLFNGEDLEGWVVQGMEKAGPRVEDGVMIVGGWDYWAVITEDEFDDFVLRLDYRTEARGNSGILFHTPHEEVYKSTNLEIQITEEDVRNPMEATGAIFGLVEPLAHPQKPAGEWNRLEVRYQHPKLWVSINDVVVQDGVDITTIDGLVKELDAGGIAIQRNDYKRAVHFRNIRIQPLDDAAQAAQTDVEVFCRYQTAEGSFYGQVDGEIIYELCAAPWANGEITGVTLAIDQARLLHPSVPTKIVGLAGAFPEAWEDSEPFNTVRWFLKPPTSAASPFEPIVLPAALDELLVETELAIVIGQRVKDADEATAAEAIFGYTVANDVAGSVESYQRLSGETVGQTETILPVALKHGDNFTPFGPFIHRGVDWRDRARVMTIISPDGEEQVYEHTTSTLLYTPEKIVSDLSRVFALEPGDIILTGTTAALPARSGDRVMVSVEGLGTLENPIQ